MGNTLQNQDINTWYGIVDHQLSLNGGQKSGNWKPPHEQDFSCGMCCATRHQRVKTSWAHRILGHTEAETNEHLFLTCPLTAQLWQHIIHLLQNQGSWHGLSITESARGTRKTNLIWEKKGYNVNNPSLLSVRPTQGVYIYLLKLVNLVRPWTLVGGLLVKPVNPTWKTTFYFIFSYFRRHGWVQCYRTHVCTQFSVGRVAYGIWNIDF